ncbi:MAG: nitroreductase family protein [Candidatus Aminicenantes bacterium]|nr:nitroreductase family protein [Candidatus Aminicenantes bacterium]
MKPITFPAEFDPLVEQFSNLAERRYSCRSFSGAPLPANAGTRLVAAITSLNHITPVPLRLALFDAAELRRRNLFTTGTYGMIRRPAAYLAGITAPASTRDWLEFGRVMQSTLMLATYLDIQSCWIGGVFDRRTCGRILDLSAEEKVPAVVALGLAAGRRTLRDRLVRWSSGKGARRPIEELCFHHRWGDSFDPSRRTDLAPLLENLRRAPSASNRQPWRVVVRENQLDLYLVRTPGYQRLVPAVDLQAIDMGIAASHLEWSARERGIKMSWGDPPPQVSADAEPILTAILNTEA